MSTSVRMQTIGVLGGVGPQATMAFEEYVHRVSQELIAPSAMEGYPPMVVLYHRSAPFVTDDAGAPALPRRPDPRLLVAAAQLGAVADFLVVTSNATHLFQSEIEEAAGCEVLSLVELALDEVRRRGWQHVGVVGFGDPLVYTRPLTDSGSTVAIPRDVTQAPLDRAIHRVMEGRQGDDDTRAARDALRELRSHSVDGIVIGCTEIPPLIAPVSEPDLIDPLPLLAEAAVRRALGVAPAQAQPREHAEMTDASSSPLSSR